MCVMVYVGECVRVGKGTAVRVFPASQGSREGVSNVFVEVQSL